jgi:uncharacterized protein DUF222/HNH endonuclease
MQEPAPQWVQELGPQLIALRREIDLLELEFAGLAAQFASTNEFERDGSNTPTDWIRINCHMTGPAAANSIAVGDNLGRLEKSTVGAMGGELGYAHLVVLARTADATGEAFNERDLLEKALENSPGKLHFLCRHYRHAKNPKAHADEEADLFEQRFLKMGTCPNGGMSVSGFLDPVNGEALRSALEPLARKDGADDERDRGQRMADAMLEAVTGGGIKANIQVTATVETLARLAGSSAADLQYGLPISSEALGQLACDCSITRVLLDSESQVIDLGRAKRLPSAPMRRALEARDGGCRWPECDRPAKWSASHHLIPWTEDGPTDLDKLVLLCHRHHKLVHEGGWQVVRAEDGKLLTIPPAVQFDRHYYPRGPD